jgi:ATP-dependent Lon protease
LRGKVLPIGGLKEKVLAANRAGVDTVVVPEDNRRDADEIPENVKKAVRMIFVDEMPRVLDIALVRSPERKPVDRKRR